MKRRTLVIKYLRSLRLDKIANKVFLLLIFIVIMAGLWAAQWRMNNADMGMREQLLVQVTVIAESISAEQVRNLSFTSADRDNPQYQRLHRQMKAYAMAENYRSIYTMGLRDGKLIFGPENFDSEDILASPPGTVYEKPPREFYQVFETGERGTVGPYKDEYGNFISAYAPVVLPRTGEVLMVVAMDREISEWQKEINALKLLPLFFTLLLIGLLAYSRLILDRKRITRIQKRLDYTESLITLALGLIITIAIVGLLYENEILALYKDFNQIAKIRVASLAHELLSLENDSLLSLGKFFEADEQVTREEFTQYTSSMVRNKKVQAWQWVSRVPAAEREAFEKRTRQEGIKDFFIFEKDREDNKIAAGVRDTYYTVSYIEPLQENREVLGYDAGSEKIRRSALLEAETTKLNSASQPVRLIQDRGANKGIIVYRPIFKEQQGERPEGFVGLVLRLQQMLSETLTQSAYGDISICMNWSEITLRNTQDNLAFYCPDSPSDDLALDAASLKQRIRFVSVYPVFVFGRSYNLTAFPGASFLKEHQPWKAWLGLFLGLLLTFILTFLVRLVNNRRFLLEEKVRERTAQLAENEERLRLALEASHQGSYDVDLTTGNVLVSPHYALMLGYDPSEFQESVEKWRSRLHPEERELIFAIFEDFIMDRIHCYQVEFRQQKATGEWIWILSLGKIITRDNQGRALRMLGTHTDITERKQAEAKIQQLAYYDSLTGLPNRLLLFDRVEKAISKAKKDNYYGAVLFIDLDRFKNLNDARGHAAGDRLLAEVAIRLKMALGNQDTISRFGGDEFVVLLPEVSPELDMTTKLSLIKGEKILTYLSAPFLFEGEEVIIGASIGVSIFPKAQETANDILKEADTAMYQAKAGGRNRVVAFETTMQIEAECRYTLEREIRRALEEEQFLLYLQPQVDVTGNLMGAEVLLRWQHPVRGLMPPSAFLPIAEETRLIVPIGEWALRKTCYYLAEIHALGSLLHLSVNVSPHQFCQPNFVKTVKSILATTGAEPTHLTLEVTECLIMENIHQAVATMLELKTLGINFSIDDFGTGYSSLAYLKRLPVNELKIDRSFVQDAPRDPNDAALVEAIISVARHFQLEIVAEGVETKEQAEFLKKRGCNYYQGYLYGKPVPIEQFNFQPSQKDNFTVEI